MKVPRVGLEQDLEGRSVRVVKANHKLLISTQMDPHLQT